MVQTRSAARRKISLAPVALDRAADLSAAAVAKATAPLPRCEIVKAHRPRDLGVRTEASVDDVMGSLIYSNMAAENVLAKISNGDGIATYANVKLADRPINYMRFRSKRPISSEQYAAAEVYRSDADNLAKMGSNSQAIFQHLDSSWEWDSKYRENRMNGKNIKPGDDSGSVKNFDAPLLSSAWRVRRATQRIDGLDKMLLDQLVLQDMPIGAISVRMGETVEAVSALARRALWQLAKIYVQVDAEFRAWAIMQRMAGNEMNEDNG